MVDAHLNDPSRDQLQYVLAPVVEADKEAVRTLNGRCFRDLVERQFGMWDEAWQNHYFDQKWDPARFKKVLAGGNLIGVISVQKHPDHIFISQILIDPDNQRQGYGSAILLDIMRLASEKGVPVRLQVFHQNDARALYERLGFEITGATDTHYQMEKKI
jgi:ribosomal protein S18 acetylase RimI-like enzyme